MPRGTNSDKSPNGSNDEKETVEERQQGKRQGLSSSASNTQMITKLSSSSCTTAPLNENLGGNTANHNTDSVHLSQSTIEMDDAASDGPGCSSTTSNQKAPASATASSESKKRPAMTLPSPFLSLSSSAFHDSTNDGKKSQSKRKKKRTTRRESQTNNTTPQPSTAATAAKSDGCFEDSKKKSRSKRQKSSSLSSSKVNRKKTIVVTPSPNKGHQNTQTVASDTSNTSSSSSNHSSSSSSSSSVQSKKQKVTINLPKGVVDIYNPAKRRDIEDQRRRLSCSCLRLYNHCTSASLTESYLSSYGWDYSKMLRDKENTIDQPVSYNNNRMHNSSSEEDEVESFTSALQDGWVIISNANTAVAKDALFLQKRQHDTGVNAKTTKMNVDYMTFQKHLTPKMRSILMDWLIELAGEYNLNPNTLHLAVKLVDVTLNCQDFIIEKELLQCLGCACMWMASKLEEIKPPSVNDFVYISDNTYTKEQICNMELSACTKALNFRLHHTTSYSYLHEYMRASEACTMHPNIDSSSALSTSRNPILESMVMYLLDLSLLSYELVLFKPSLITAAAVYLARATLGISDFDSLSTSTGTRTIGFWTKTLQYYTGYDIYDLEDAVLTIHRYQHGAEESNLKTVFNNYRSPSKHHVSLKTVLPVEDLGF